MHTAPDEVVSKANRLAISAPRHEVASHKLAVACGVMAAAAAQHAGPGEGAIQYSVNMPVQAHGGPDDGLPRIGITMSGLQATDISLYELAAYQYELQQEGELLERRRSARRLQAQNSYCEWLIYEADIDVWSLGASSCIGIANHVCCMHGLHGHMGSPA